MRRVREYVRGDPMDEACRRSGLRGDGYCIRIDVDPRKFHRNAARMRPALNTPQSVAVTATYVENVDRLRAGMRDKCVEPMELRAIAQGQPVEQSQVAETGAQFVAAAGLIHAFS